MEAAHTHPKEERDSGDVWNGIGASKLHRWASDSDCLSICDEYEVLVREALEWRRQSRIRYFSEHTSVSTDLLTAEV